MKLTYTTSLLKRESEAFLHVALGNKKFDEVVIENGIRTLVIGVESIVEINNRAFPILIRRMVRKAQEYKAEKIVVLFNDFNSILNFRHLGLSDTEIAEIFGRNIVLANYNYNKYKTQNLLHEVKEIILVGSFEKEVKIAFENGMMQAFEINKMRDMANAPGSDMTPTILANDIKKNLKGLPIKVNVIGEIEMKKLGMHAILAVGRGSKEESKFIEIIYSGGKKGEKPIVLVGKGVTFDTGGINLKPSNSLMEMNMDMSGGASVSAVIAIAAKNKLKRNIVGLIPSVENMQSGESYRPNDVIKSMSGLTIEVRNTDAEGRVILADALHYAKGFKPELVIDVATLTGAACVALGTRASAIFSKDEKVIMEMMKAGEETCDFVWPLPLWDEYEQEVKGSLGDFTNTQNKDSRYGGAITAAIFLYQFIKGTPWVHVDMAPRMTATPDEFLAPGSSGAPVAMLYNFIKNLK